MNIIDELYPLVEEAISSISDWDIDDIYVISFFIYDYEDDPRYPTLRIGYNTISRWRSTIKDASDSDEAKWNYAFWLQNKIGHIGMPDKTTADIITEWIKGIGLDYTDEEVLLMNSEDITKEFVNLCIEMAKRLHKEKSIIRKFQKSIPIIIHELEYYFQIALQTEQANPKGVADEFTKWVTDP